MDWPTDEAGNQAPWQVMFSDDTVLRARAKSEFNKEELEVGREALEKRGMKKKRIKRSRAKTE